MLYNRSGFSYEAKCIMDRLKAEDKNVFIIFIDADGLKKVNDSIGHEMGDMMIRELGAIVHRNVSNEMLGMRYGGDEFVLFGGFADKDKGMLDRILQSIQDDIADVNKSNRFPFTVAASVGASYYKAREVDSLDALIEQADKEMYEEKRKKKMR
jgi:diguanylate cyclase (GGDEF)-like protein